MSLTDAQIDRYSRQIIVPHVGGRGQERLLCARMLIAGDARDIEAPLAYLVGAGVGTIHARSSAGRVVHNETNADVSIIAKDETQGAFDLSLIFVGSEAARKVADEIARSGQARSLLIARLDQPGSVVVAPNANVHADAQLRAALGRRSEAADFVAMVATTEAFKLLAGYDENPSPTIIEFDGYATRVRALP
jgi:hypothetical protein